MHSIATFSDNAFVAHSTVLPAAGIAGSDQRGAADRGPQQQPHRFSCRDELLRFIKVSLQPRYDAGELTKPRFVAICKNTLQFVMQHPIGSGAWNSRFVGEALRMQLDLVDGDGQQRLASSRAQPETWSAPPSAPTAPPPRQATVSSNLTSVTPRTPQDPGATSSAPSAVERGSGDRGGAAGASGTAFADHRRALRSLRSRLQSTVTSVSASGASSSAASLDGAAAPPSADYTGDDVPVLVDPPSPRRPGADRRAAINDRTRRALDAQYLASSTPAPPPPTDALQEEKSGGGGGWSNAAIAAFLRGMEERHTALLDEASARSLVAQEEAAGFLRIAASEAAARRQAPVRSPMPRDGFVSGRDGGVGGAGASVDNSSVDAAEDTAAALLCEIDADNARVEELLVAIRNKGEVVQRLMLERQRRQQEHEEDYAAASGSCRITNHHHRERTDSAPPAIAAAAPSPSAIPRHFDPVGVANAVSPSGEGRSALAHFANNRGISSAATAGGGGGGGGGPSPILTTRAATRRAIDTLCDSAVTPLRRAAPRSAGQGTSSSSSASHRSPHTHARTPQQQQRRHVATPTRTATPTGPSRLEVVEHIRLVLQPAYDRGALPRAKFAAIVRAVSSQFFSRQWRSGTPDADAAWQGFLEERIVEIVSRKDSNR